MKRSIVTIAAVVACVEWTRLAGTVKSINLRDSSVTIQDREGALLTIPVDYQVRLSAKDGEPRDLKRLALDEKIILTRTPMEKPVEDTGGLAPPMPEPSQRGYK